MAKGDEYFDLNKVENLAATLPSYSQISQRLGKQPGYVQYRSKKDADFKAAIERGREKFIKQNGASEHGATKRADAKLDRDGMETGGYRPPEARARIIASLETIPFQSSRHLCANTNASIDDVLEVVETDEEIRFKMVGSIPVYHLTKNAPREGDTLYNTGENSFALKKGEKKLNDPKRGQKSPLQDKLLANLATVEKYAFDGKSVKELADALGLKYNSVNFTLSKVPEIKEAWKRGKEMRQTSKLPSIQKQTAQSRKSAVTPEAVEECAFEGLSMKEAAERIGTSLNNFRFYYYSKRKPEIKEAWERGLKRREKEKTMQTETPADFLETVKYQSIPVTDAEDEAFREIANNQPAFGDEKVKLAQVIEMDDEDFAEVESAIDNLVAKNGHQLPVEAVEEIVESFGRLGEVETDARFEHTIEHISQNGHSRESLERVKTKLCETAPLPEIAENAGFRVSVASDLVRPFEAHAVEFSNVLESEPAHYKTVELSGGKSLRLESDINIFELKPREAQLFKDLIGIINQFEQSEN